MFQVSKSGVLLARQNHHPHTKNLSNRLGFFNGWGFSIVFWGKALIVRFQPLHVNCDIIAKNLQKTRYRLVTALGWSGGSRLH